MRRYFSPSRADVGSAAHGTGNAQAIHVRALRPSHLAICIALLSASPISAKAQERWRLATGVSEQLVLGPVSSAASTSWDVMGEGPLHRALTWSAGGRLALGQLSPEGFARLSASPYLGSWEPSLGVELGVGRRAHDDHGGALVSELRDQSRTQLVPVYLAMHAVPLRFALWKRLFVSVLELQVGSYVAPFGRFVRLHLGFVSGGIAL